MAPSILLHTFCSSRWKTLNRWCRGFKLTELTKLCRYTLKAALSVLSLGVATSVACTVPPLLALIMPGLKELLSAASHKAVNNTATKHVQDLMKDLQQTIPNAEDDAAQHMQERSVGFDTSLSTQDATVTTFALEGDTQQHDVKTRRGLGENENFTITVSGSKTVWVGVTNFKNDAADVTTIFYLDDGQLQFPNDVAKNVDVILTRTCDKLMISWGEGTRQRNVLALKPLGLDEEWVPVVATNDSKCRVHITLPSFPYIPPGESFESFLVNKNNKRRNSNHEDNKDYEDWCGLSYHDNNPDGYGDGKGTPMWICKTCIDIAKKEQKKKRKQHAHNDPTENVRINRAKTTTATTFF